MIEALRAWLCPRNAQLEAELERWRVRATDTTARLGAVHEVLDAPRGVLAAAQEVLAAAQDKLAEYERTR